MTFTTYLFTPTRSLILPKLSYLHNTSMRKGVYGGSGRQLVLRSSCRMIAKDRNMSTTFARSIKSRVNRHGSLLASPSAASSVQDLVAGICTPVRPRARRQATPRMYPSPVILGYCLLSISHQGKGLGHWQRDTPLGKLHRGLDGNGGAGISRS